MFALVGTVLAVAETSAGGFAAGVQGSPVGRVTEIGDDGGQLGYGIVAPDLGFS